MPTLELQPRLDCPSCWQSLDPADLLWVSAHADLVGDPYLGSDAYKRFLPSRFDAAGFALDAKGERCHALACPRCHLPVSRILTELKPVFVSVLGGPYSGKSYLLAAAIWELRKRLHAFKVGFSDADPAANREISEREQKLFLSDSPDQVVAIDKTQPTTDTNTYRSVNYGDRVVMYAYPFLFALRPDADHPVLLKGRDARKASRVLCVYDNAGEHFMADEQTEQSPVTDHLALSQSLIYVFDPTQHNAFRTRCREISDDPQLHVDSNLFRQDEILQVAASRVRKKANLPTHGKIKKPLIVAMSKYDVWGSLMPEIDLAAISPYRKGPDGLTLLDLTTLAAVSQRTQALVAEVAPDIVAACRSVSDDVIYLPVSSQGCSPVRGEDAMLGVRPVDLAPVWAEVPFIYSLFRSKTSLIPAYTAGVGRESGAG